MQSFMPIHYFVFKIQMIKNGFPGPKSVRDYRETGPGVRFSFGNRDLSIDEYRRVFFQIISELLNLAQGHCHEGLEFLSQTCTKIVTWYP